MKRRLLTLGAGLICSAAILFAAPLTDDFFAGDGTNLVGHLTSSGGTWVNTGAGSWSIQSNKAQGALFFTNTALLSDAAFPNAQYAQVVTKAVSADPTRSGVLLRSTIAVFVTNVGGNADVNIYEDTGGGFAYLTDFLSGVASNTLFTLKGEVILQRVDVYVDPLGGTSFGATIGHATVTAASGKPGLYYNTGATHPTIDNFECTAPSASSSSRHTGSLLGMGPF